MRGYLVQPYEPPLDDRPMITSCVFRVRNVPAALYKAMGGFATNGVNMTKLESYMVGGEFDIRLRNGAAPAASPGTIFAVPLAYLTKPS